MKAIYCHCHDCSRVVVCILLSFEHCTLQSDMIAGLAVYGPRETSVSRW